MTGENYNNIRLHVLLNNRDRIDLKNPRVFLVSFCKYRLATYFFFRFYDQIQWLKLGIDIMFVFVDEFMYALFFFILAVEILKVN